MLPERKVGREKEVEHLSTDRVADILGCNARSIDYMVNKRVLTPPRNPNRHLVWNQESIFKLFLALQLFQEFDTAYGTSGRFDRYRQVSSNLRVALRGSRKDKTLRSEKWRDVTQEAKKAGLSFKGTRYDYIEPESS